MNNEILQQVETYYAQKIKTFGATPEGVDWNSTESQYIRFDQLLKIVPADKEEFSLLDYGCGYGAFLNFLLKQYNKVTYTGYDISEDMLQYARKANSLGKNNWISKKENLETYDYIVASGIFNVKQNVTDPEWYNYVLETLNHINKISKHGFSFNILTKYSDEEYKKEYLYYADPLLIFDYCKKNFSPNIALLHDYKLYEFTILVRKI